MQALTETSARKILFLSPSDLAPIKSKSLSIPIPDLIYHGLIQDTSQEVSWNSNAINDNICVIAVGDACPTVMKELIHLQTEQPNIKVNVLFVDDYPNPDISGFEGSNIKVEFISAPENLSLTCIGKPQEESSFLDANHIFVDGKQMHVFQTMIAFLEDNGFKFIETPKKLNWHLSAPFNALKGEINAFNLEQSSGFAYDESKTTVPFVYKYNHEIAETAAAAAKPLTRPSAFSLFQSNALLIGSVTAVGALIATAIIYSCWPLALAAAAIMIIAYANGAFSEKAIAPQSP